MVTARRTPIGWIRCWNHFCAIQRSAWWAGKSGTLQFDKGNKVEHYCEQVGFLSVGDRMGMKAGGYYPPIQHGYPREVNGSQTCPFFATANAAVSKKAAIAIGNHFWDEITAEDVDFSLSDIRGRLLNCISSR